MRYHIKARFVGQDDWLIDAEVEADSPQLALVELYNRANQGDRRGRQRPAPRGIGLWSHFKGGNTAHVQMAHNEGGGQSLDARMVVQWTEQAP